MTAVTCAAQHSAAAARGTGARRQPPAVQLWRAGSATWPAASALAGAHLPARQLHQHSGGAHYRSCAAAAAASFSGEPSLITLPVFPLPSVLHPTQDGVLSVFEPRYLAMFQDMLNEHPGGAGARFLHILSPSAAPPALLENAVGGLPRIGCCAEVLSVQEGEGGNLIVRYRGTRRVQLLLVQQEEPYLTVAAEYFDDAVVDDLLDPTVDVLERETARMLHQIESLTSRIDPDGGTLPEAVRQYHPPAVQKKTSYDALKAAGHRAAGHIEMWRRHGSVYKTQRRSSAAAADPYDAIRESMGKGRRQELFSFAAAQLLVMGTPERTALLLSQDTGARLNFVLAALHPYMLELQAKASLKSGLE